MKINILKNKRIHGFSLVEICIACIILMVLIVPVFTLLSQGNSGTTQNKNEIYARAYASNILAFCNLIPFNSKAIKDDIEIELDGNPDVNTIKEKLGLVLKPDDNPKIIDLNFDEDIYKSFLQLLVKRKISIKNVKVGEWGYNYKLVLVKIEWKEAGKAVNNSVEISGLVSER